MPVGLGEITPIKLQLTRENFNALIGRHSQPVRWLESDKCPCIQDNLRVDADCPICEGKGVSYDTPTETTRIETFTAPIDGIIEQSNVIWVRDFAGNEYTITSTDCVAYVDGVKKGQQYQVKYIEDVTLSGTGTATYVSESLYKIDLSTKVDFGEVQGSLLTVTATNNGTPLTVNNIFRNFFEIDEVLTSSDVVDVIYTYVDPFKFVIVNNNFSKSDQKYLDEINGDGIMIFPQRWEVFENDIIIALNSTLTHKDVIRSTGDIDALPSFYPYELKSAYVIRSDAKYEFTPDVDFIIYKENLIKWIGDKPTVDEQMSITFSYNTTYRVMNDFPAPRTSEDNRFPRKVALKIVAGYNSREGF